MVDVNNSWLKQTVNHDLLGSVLFYGAVIGLRRILWRLCIQSDMFNITSWCSKTLSNASCYSTTWYMKTCLNFRCPSIDYINRLQNDDCNYNKPEKNLNDSLSVDRLIIEHFIRVIYYGFLCIQRTRHGCNKLGNLSYELYKWVFSPRSRLSSFIVGRIITHRSSDGFSS